MNTLTTRHHQDHRSDYKKLAKLMYLLQALGFFLGGVTFIIAAVLAVLNQHHVKGTWLESHYQWQLDTFWVALCLILVGTFTMWMLVGYMVILGALIWTVHRIVFGWINLNRGLAVKALS